MVTGRVVRFDGARGYGFIAPDHSADNSGEDVFLHVNDLLIPESAVRSGLVVEFEIEEGDRGLKASSVRLPEGAELPSTSGGRQPAGDDSMCDLLSAEEFLHEVTETLLSSEPSLTGDQILRIRRGLLQFGKGHGWTEG